MEVVTTIKTKLDIDKSQIEIFHPGTYEYITLLIRNRGCLDGISVMNFCPHELDELIKVLVYFRKDWDSNKEYKH
tara:strand:- start:1887 stop:2111 length:225 start_codon:yes stop_codon:yes gene_type:complete